MADQRIYQEEWRDEQSDSRYPFTDNSTLTTDSGLVLTNDTFFDAIFYPVAAGPRLYLTGFHAEGSRSVTLYIGDTTTPQLASVQFDPLNPPDSLVFVDQHGRPAGVIVSDASHLNVFQTWPLGDASFGTTAEFCSSVVIPTPGPGLRGILLDDGTFLTDDVWIVGENGVVVRQDGDGIIRFDLVGDPLFVRSLCQNTDLFTTPRFIQTINGQKPNSSGAFLITVNNQLAGDTILRVYPDPVANVLRIEVVGQKAEGVI